MSNDNLSRLRELIETSDSPGTLEEAIGLVYDELRAVAAHHLRHERDDHTLQPTALVHEVYMRLAQQRSLSWENRVHFIRIAAAQIRRVLIDHARARNRQKRGGGLLRVTLTDAAASTEWSFDLLALNHAMEKLHSHSELDSQIVELKYFGGLTEAEVAAVLDIGERTVRRRWNFSRAWLFRELGEADT